MWLVRVLSASCVAEGEGAWKGEILLASVFFFLSNCLAAGRELAGLELPSSHRMEKGVSEFFVTTAPGGSLERFGLGNVPGHVRSPSPGEMLSLRPSSFLAPTEAG